MTEPTQHVLEAIVLGGSTGSIDALARILPALPADYPIPIAVTLHVPPREPSVLAPVLAGMTAVAVHEPLDKDSFALPGIHVAPPDYHLLIESTRCFALSADDPVHFSRPSIDVLFETAADVFGPAVAGVLLSGASEDGARGLLCIRRAGGTTVVQSPESAAAATMPEAAMRLEAATHVLSPADIGRFLASLAEQEPTR
jgi:two-component system, chemotaxis family, protein-glutamate methylesterase/glutaminase